MRDRCVQVEKRKSAKNEREKMKTKWLIYSIILILISVYYYQCEYLYYKEFNQVKEEFNKIDGVKILDIGIGNPDITAEEIYAKVLVNDKVEIGFSSSIFPLCFYEETPVRINEFGNWKFYYLECQGEESNQYDWWNGTFNLGLDGEFNTLSKKKIKNIKEAILNTKEIESIVNLIPEYPKIGMINRSVKRYSSTKFIYKYRKDLKEIPKVNTLNCDSLSFTAIDLNKK
jgi:hypothetical protein